MFEMISGSSSGRLTIQVDIVGVGASERPFKAASR